MAFVRSAGFPVAGSGTASSSNPGVTQSITPHALGDVVEIGIGSFAGFGGGPILVTCPALNNGAALPILTTTTQAAFNVATAWGVVTGSVGVAATVAITYPAITSDFTSWTIDAYSSAGASGYAITASGPSQGTGTAVAFANLSTDAAGGMYWGAVQPAGTLTGPASGFTVEAPGLWLLWNLGLAASTAYNESLTQPTGTWFTGAMIIKALTALIGTTQDGFSRGPTGVLATSTNAGTMQTGFLRDSNGSLVLSTGSTGTWQTGFLRDAGGALVTIAYGSATGMLIVNGFLRDSSYRLVTVTTGTVAGTPAYQNGFLRDANFALVIG
jgi:hypothetical protein